MKTFYKIILFAIFIAAFQSSVSAQYQSPNRLSGANYGYAMRFDHAKGHNVYAGQFYKTGTAYSKFWIDALVRPEQSAEYIWSSGYGGLHNILFGLDGGSAGWAAVQGNISNSTGSSVATSFTSGSDKIQLGAWNYIAAGYDKNYLIVYVNCVSSRRIAWTADRMSNQLYEIDGYIGGSDHSNFHGLLRWLRIVENDTLLAPASTGTAFRCERYPRATYNTVPGLSWKTVSGLWDFSVMQDVVTDKSQGFEGVLHHGSRQLGTNPNGFGGAFTGTPDSELPQWEALTSPIAKPATTLTPLPVPSGALIYDSFNRDDVTYLWQNTLGLGSTEGGSLGSVAWQGANVSLYGILSGRTYANGGFVDPVYLDAGRSDVRVNALNNGNETSEVQVYTAYDFATSTGARAVCDGRYVYFYTDNAGAPTGHGFVDTGSNNAPHTIGLEYTSAHHIKLYINGVLASDYDASGDVTLTGTKVGFRQTSAYNRIDTFEARPAGS